MKAASIRPITDLKNRAKDLIHEVSSSGGSVVITQNGKPMAVLMDAKAHDRLQDTLALLKILAQSQQSLRRGRPHTTDEVRSAARAALAQARRLG